MLPPSLLEGIRFLQIRGPDVPVLLYYYATFKLL